MLLNQLFIMLSFLLEFDLLPFNGFLSFFNLLFEQFNSVLIVNAEHGLHRVFHGFLLFAILHLSKHGKLRVQFIVFILNVIDIFYTRNTLFFQPFHFIFFYIFNFINDCTHDVESANLTEPFNMFFKVCFYKKVFCVIVQMVACFLFNFLIVLIAEFGSLFLQPFLN